MASHWVVDELHENLEDIATLLVIVGILVLAAAAEMWRPITIPILILAIGSIAYIAYRRVWWPFGFCRKKKKAVDPPD